ncbi:MAG: hypothetical protein JO329_08455 [Planctomycetaceae bacterium]|nr:hypothetical protein [Planctomycetaceae bacterium]
MDAPRAGDLNRINAAGGRFEEARARGDRPRIEDDLAGSVGGGLSPRVWYVCADVTHTTPLGCKVAAGGRGIVEQSEACTGSERG